MKAYNQILGALGEILIEIRKLSERVTKLEISQAKKRRCRFCKGLDQVDREEILLGVEMKVLELVLTKELSAGAIFSRSLSPRLFRISRTMSA